MSIQDIIKERPLQKLSDPSGVHSRRTCKACGKEFELDEYLDHVYDNDECYKAYLASEKKEMSKQ
ncbi:MAG: hypothetical protein M1368_02090 [Thaumarchaeota archaeon]|nr:hypothetical protein [Nitrososphaerota archaeon]